MFTMFYQRQFLMIVVVLSNLPLPILCTGIGRCPRIKYMEDFNITRFTGQWYEIERSFYLMQIISSCVTVELKTKRHDQLKVSVNAKNRWSDSLTVSEGLATQTKRDPTILNYKVISKLPKMLNKYLPGTGYYQIIDTDYDNYAILWSCTNYGLLHTDLIWIWARQLEINAKLRSHIYNLLQQLHLDSERLVLPKNSNCTDDLL